MEDHEYRLLQIPDLFERATALGIQTQRFPIRDVDAPPAATMASFRQLIADILSAAGQGDTVVIHCRRAASVAPAWWRRAASSRSVAAPTKGHRHRSARPSRSGRGARAGTLGGRLLGSHGTDPATSQPENGPPR